MDSLTHNDIKKGIVLSSKILLSRNLSNLPFPNKLNYIKGRDNGKNIYNALKNELKDEELTLYEIWNTNDDFGKQYLERDLITEELIKNSDKSSFILNKDENISIMINEKDHINLQCISEGFSLENAFERAINIDDKIEHNFDYAFDENLGYLTASPENIGTGMKASVVLHLPALTMSEEIKKISKNLSKAGFNIKGIYLEDTKVYGNLYRITNKVSLGLSEENIISRLRFEVLNVIREENKFREILFSKCKYELEDKVYRSYGILRSAILLDYKETVEMISNVRLGVEVSFIMDIDESRLDKLLTLISDASLQSYLGRYLDAKEIKFERAKLVNRLLN
ncbi:protein arginine kinase [Clostridium sp. C2-6-12]|uniref:protein arginine kinase n=1 Tax=Clostridium sp. C2-6-12 TaxID=2698832 RepID=UPI0013713479|nr:protein arginine kinase [Clostridium sp. C2-6-12]